MKIAFTILISGLICTSMHAAEDLSDTLRRGLFEEEANQNFDAAIQAYRGLIASHDNDRKLAATATYRLGECYRKLGRTNEAIAQYERVLQTFGDQPTLVTVCRQNLAGLGAAAAVPGGTSRSASSTVGRESLTTLQAESAALAALEQRLEAMPRPELRRAMPTAYPDALLARLLEQLSVMETKLAALTNQFSREHPDVQSILSQEKTLNREIEERLDGILAGLKLKSESMQDQIELVGSPGTELEFAL